MSFQSFSEISSLVIDYTYQNSNKFVSLCHQFKISKCHLHGLFGNRLQDLVIDFQFKNILLLNWLNFYKGIFYNKKKLWGQTIANKNEVLLTIWLSPYLWFSWSCLLTWNNVCFHQVNSFGIIRTCMIHILPLFYDDNHHQVNYFGIIKTYMIHILPFFDEDNHL